MNKFKNHKLVFKNLLFIVTPAIIFPLINVFPIIDETSKMIFIIITCILFTYIVVFSSLKEEKDNQELRKELNSYQKYQMSQKILNSIMEVEKLKRNLLKVDVLPDYKKEVLLYNPHEFVEQICSNIKLLISNITEITLSSLSVSFIYQYPEHNSNWQWITRKNSMKKFFSSKF